MLTQLPCCWNDRSYFKIGQKMGKVALNLSPTRAPTRAPTRPRPHYLDPDHLSLTPSLGGSAAFRSGSVAVAIAATVVAAAAAANVATIAAAAASAAAIAAPVATAAAIVAAAVAAAAAADAATIAAPAAAVAAVAAAADAATITAPAAAAVATASPAPAVAAAMGRGRSRGRRAHERSGCRSDERRRGLLQGIGSQVCDYGRRATHGHVRCHPRSQGGLPLFLSEQNLALHARAHRQTGQYELLLSVLKTKHGMQVLLSRDWGSLRLPDQ